jgi:rubredoxin
VANRHRSVEELREIDSVVERLRDFVRLNYISVEETARRIRFSEGTLYSWLHGKSRPAEPERIAAFLDSLPTDRGSGIAPTGYEYREYKNWRGIPKPRSCPFCKQAKGEVRRVRGGYQGVCPNCGATGPKRQNYDVSRCESGANLILLYFCLLGTPKSCLLVRSLALRYPRSIR